jgi:hypothetical protein
VRDLVVVRTGRGSRHPEWVAGAGARTFDVLGCPYEEGAPRGDLPGEVVVPGPKWTGLADVLLRDPRWRDYDRVWLPDDDLRTTAADVTRFFDLCRRHGAAIAAPALSEDSGYSHVLMLRNRSFVARETTFVEIMAPCFRRDVLEHLLRTLPGSRSGWGLDDAWGRLLGYRGLFVFDEVTLVHPRAVGGQRSRRERREAREEMHRTRLRFGAARLRKSIAGFDSTGARIDESDPRFLPLYLDGYRWLWGGAPDVEARLRRDQAEPAAVPA